MKNSIPENLQTFSIKQALKMIRTNPEKNIPKLMTLVDTLCPKDTLVGQRNAIREYISDPDNTWYKFILSLWDDVDDNCRETLFNNFIINTSVLGTQRQNKIKEKYDCNVPWAILMDPTSACNLHCTGCWAAEYGDKLNMTYDELDSIITQGKEMGTYMFIYSGGEPLIRKKDILRLCEKHNDCMFLAFTNGTLIDEAFAKEMLRVKNFIPAISIEGDAVSTDGRRGNGVYDRVIHAMKILKENKLIFGASLCYTSQNTDVMGSEEYFDFLIDQGCKFAWYFTYMPVGVGAPTDLIATAEQRAYMYQQIRKFRNNPETAKPLFTMDFWNDGEFVNGCIAGGRIYLHINANGDIEPCAFIHYSDSNIRKNTLLEAYTRPLFTEYKKGQPFNENLLRPCPLLDNQGALADMVHTSGAHSTDMEQKEDVDALTLKCKNAADNWAPVADKIWDETVGKDKAQDEKAHNGDNPCANCSTHQNASAR